MTAQTTTRPTCAFEWSGYPHPGAAEFGEPDHYECSAEATWRVWFPATDQPYEDPEGTVVHFCGDHYIGVTAETPDAEAVLISDLPDVRCGDCGDVVWLPHAGDHSSPCSYCAIFGGRPDEDHPSCSCPALAAMSASSVEVSA